MNNTEDGKGDAFASSGEVEELKHEQELEDLANRILRSLRRIIRFTEIYSRNLTSNFNVTGPQLVCLVSLNSKVSMTVSQIAHDVSLSPSTIVGIVDRLSEKGLVTRQRNEKDRRVVDVALTETGKKLLATAPPPLQGRLHNALEELPQLERATIALSLERIVDLMEAKDIDAAPIIEVGPIHEVDKEGPR